MDVLEVMARAAVCLADDYPVTEQDLTEARAAVVGLVDAARSNMAKHDAEAVSCNFSRCGCYYCTDLRAALAKFTPEAQP